MDVARLALAKGLDRFTMAKFFRRVARHINADLLIRLYPLEAQQPDKPST